MNLLVNRFTAPVMGAALLAPAYGPPPKIGAIIGAAGIFIALMAAAFALFYAPGPPRCTLAAGSLSIHDRLYPVTLRAEAVDVDHIRIVDLDSDPDWVPTLRTNGFSNLHYHSGWYRVRNGQKIRLYRADGRRVVLLPPKGAGNAVLYEVADPERFVAEIRREWTGHA